MSRFWKKYPPGWFAYDRWWEEGDDDDDGGDGDGGGGDDGGGEGDDGGGDGGGGGFDGGDDDDDDDDDDSDGDGGHDFDWDRQQAEEEERDREREREREDERRREEQRRREEEERQRQIEEQERQIEENRRRMEEENQRRLEESQQGNPLLNPDGSIPNPADQSPITDPVNEDLRQQFQDYVEQNQEGFSVDTPEQFQEWLTGQQVDSQPTGDGIGPEEMGTGFRSNRPGALDDWLARRAAQERSNREPGRIYESLVTGGPSYQLPGESRPGTAPQLLAQDSNAYPIIPKPADDTTRSVPQPGTPASLTLTQPAPVVEIAAQAAATAAAGAGGTPHDIAQAAETAARIASDHQTLGNQSAWTRAAFRSQYGDNADAEWVRQHEAELQRNQTLYGSREPGAGTRPVSGAPAGTLPAPDRRIGAVAPPGFDEDARFGLNIPRLTTNETTAPAPQTARTASPGVASPAAAGVTIPPVVTAEQAKDYVNRGINPATGEPITAGGIPVAAPSTLAPRPRAGTQIEGPRDTLPRQPVQPSVSATQAQDYQRRGINPSTGEPISAAGATVPEEPVMRPFDPDEGPRETGYTVPDAGAPGDVQPQRYDEQGNPVEYIQGRLQPIRNIVDYNPVTGATRERNYTNQPMASTDTSIAPPGGYSQAATQPELTSPSGPGYRDPIQAAIDSDRPLDTLASLAAANRGPDYDSRQDALHIAHGIAGMLRGEKDAVWAEPYLNDVARLAWAREERQNGRTSDPRDTPIEYVERWKDAFYGSDHSVPMVKEVDQQMIDYAAARTPPGKPFEWKRAFGETGENGLISAQVTDRDCGPNAFSTILRSRGYNADPRQTYTFALNHQYHNGSEFTGPLNMVRMLRDEAGLNATSQAISPDGKGWERVDAELAAGRPVMLSSPGHYWVVSAKNDKGQYYAGATTLKGNPQWMARGGFSYGGPANTAILTEGDVNPNARAVREMNLPAPQTGPGNTRPLLSGQTQYVTAAQRGAARISEGMTRLNDTSSGGPAAGLGAEGEPSPQANLAPRFTVQETQDMRDRILREMPDIQFDPSDDMDTRLRKMVPALQWLKREYGFSDEALAGMAVNESGVGTAANAPAGKANNLWSVEYMPSDSQATGPIPQGRWAAYPSVKAALARFVGMYAHPENGYKYTWQSRSDPDQLMEGLIKDRYVVDEPGFPISTWRKGVNEGRARYRRIVQEMQGR